MKRTDRDKVKTEAEQRHADPNQTKAADRECHVSGNIYVRGEIETKRPPDLTKEHNTERKEDNSRQNKKFVIEVVTLIVVAIYAGLTSWQGCSTKRAADAAKTAADTAVAEARPVIWLMNNFGQPAYQPAPSRQITWELHFKNYGKTPASDVRFSEIYMKIGVDGQWTPSYTTESPEIVTHPVAPEEDIERDGVTPPGISPTQWTELLGTTKGISIKGTILYTDSSKIPYETGFCLTRLNLGGITFCKDNYIH